MFTKVSTQSELKVQYIENYKAICNSKYDLKGKAILLDTLNAQYADCFSKVGNKFTSKSGKVYYKRTQELADQFIDAVMTLFGLDVIAEYVDNSILVKGDCCHPDLKAVGYKWCASKEAWVWKIA